MSRANQHRILNELLPLLVDAVTLLLLALYLPLMAVPLKDPAGLNALFLVLFYLLFCVGVYFIRKLRPLPAGNRWQPPAILTDPKTLAFLAFLFGLLMMTTSAYQIGYFQTVQSIASATLDEGDSSALLVYMPGALLGFSMLYILVLAFPIKASNAPRSRSFWMLIFLGLLFTNGMLLISSAQAGAFKDLLAEPQAISVFVLAFFALLISFGPPRLLLQTKCPSTVAPFTFLLLLLFSAWRITGVA